MHDVAVVQNVIFAFKPHFAGVACSGFAAIGYVIFVSDGFSSYKPPLEIGMDDTSGLRRLCATGHRPCPCFLWSGSKERDEIEESVAGTNESIEAGLGKSHRFQIALTFVARQRGDLGLDLRGNDNGG